MLAYFYQHAEWEVMEEVKNIANQNNLTIIANIHDAIIFRDRLSQPLRDQMQNAMRIKTNNQFWHLEEKQISGY
jgi:ABC-type phosphate/phosphonate transport system ATPase subunit